MYVIPIIGKKLAGCGLSDVCDADSWKECGKLWIVQCILSRQLERVWQVVDCAMYIIPIVGKNPAGCRLSNVY